MNHFHTGIATEQCRKSNLGSDKGKEKQEAIFVVQVSNNKMQIRQHVETEYSFKHGTPVVGITFWKCLVLSISYRENLGSEFKL